MRENEEMESSIMKKKPMPKPFAKPSMKKSMELMKKKSALLSDEFEA